MTRLITALSLLCLMAACRPEVFPPKPPGYFKIDTPAEHRYQVFDRPGFPYTFEYPVYSSTQDDTVFQGKGEHNPYWVNINVPSLGGVINITYKKIDGAASFAKLMEDSWGLSFFHHIDQRSGTNPNGVSVITYTIGGNTASRYQFAATDSVKNFLRGALYFDVAPNADSLKPATDFLEADISHLLETLKWKN
jgi:gliding motility-associated lipoprotein GldD